MGHVPGYLLRHQVTIEPYAGQGGNGPTYGAAVLVRCFREDARKMVRNAQGEQVVSETTCYCPVGTVAPPLSRVTVGSRVAYVINTKDRDGGGLPTPDHVEVVLT